ncbi:ABC multidrug transporter-like protein [Microthyrium microscopicum]|uniref:ABC multidrug transporter-like protein n=1 Tax=Microthyrium microscopicum TaxID=703497 RepID=A0A6A6U227_9PEZI|nr:ABC multidrug transporter-like protein [Microthyrium microscopicum]
MSNPRQTEKEWESNDPSVGANTTAQDEPVASPADGDEKEIMTSLEKENSSRQLSRSPSKGSEIMYETTSIQSKPAKQKWSRRLNPLKRNPPPVPKERQVSREYTANWVSRLIFQWIQPVMTTGYKRTLELNDLYLVNPDRASRVLATKLNASFKTRLDRGDKRPLLGALYDTVKFEFLLGGACQLMSSVIQTVSPFLLRFLIAFAQDAYIAKFDGGAPPPLSRGIGLVVGILVLQVASSLCGNHFLYRGMMVGGQLRAVLMTVIFDKAMRLSGRAKAGGQSLEMPPPHIKPGSEEERKWYKKLLKKKTKKAELPDKTGILGDGRGWSNGRIINLMSVDTYRVDQASGFFHMLWTAPIQILIALVLLVINLTYSALAGFALLLIAMPILARAIRGLLKRRIGINKVTDQRVTMTQEILQSVRFVKFFGWEASFLDRIFAIRKREIFSIQKLLATRNAINAVSMSVPVFASMIAFIVYSVSNHELNPAPIFSSLALFNGLRMPLNFLPLVLGQVIDAISSVRRIQEFLLAEEASEDFEWDYENKNAVALENASFTWERAPTQDPDKEPGRGKMSSKALKAERKAVKKSDKDAAKRKAKGEKEDEDSTRELEPYKLHDMNFGIGRDELVAVIGTVGSGKSSLLAALAGDMRKTEGRIMMGASRAFCPQYAWIQNTTVRDNLVFGQEFDQAWYDTVVDACALRPDLEMLPNGDMTEIGERGITVSGGQKQRLNIARAIYFNADIVLMDDPLSAVDAHVGRHIMDNAICGLLKGKCRILATHQLHVLNRCDRIIWMDDGHIKTIDTFNNLMATSEEFQKLMSSTSQEEKEEEVKEEINDEIEEEKKATTKGAKKGVALMTIEERQTKAVGWGVYGAYVKAAGGYWVAPLVFVLLVLTQGSNIATSLWLSWWTANKWGYSKGVYIGVYAALGASQSLFMFLYSLSLSVFGTQASKHMLRDSMRRVLRAPMSFFDTTPLGRITNRFSRDIDTMDNNLTDAMRMYFMTLGMIISVFALIIAYFHYFAVALGPLFIGFCFSAAYYRSSAREIKRHEAVERSYVFSRFSEAVSGVATIRAYRLEDRFRESVRDAIDGMNGIYFLTFANQRWLSIRLDCIGNLLVFTVGLLVVTSRFSINPSIGGLVLSYILSIVQMIQFTVRQLAEVENNMNSTERLHYYATELDEEAPAHLAPVPESWPQRGEIKFNHVQMRYRDGLPLVLKDLDLHVQPGERIGIVGRTGAGKSSIMSTLFRMVEISGGSITIDNIDISTIGLLDLRTKLSIIPQDPTLFRGTIRSNLDPFGEHTDLELWHALRAADLVESDNVQTAATALAASKQATADAAKGITGDEEKQGKLHLDSTVEEEGLNFSLGQRQMMALARALVRNSQIIVCDEATSSVDFETDKKIQNTIMTAFKGKTLLCIAHRLKTIISYDRIVVMDQGRIAEVDNPLRLFEAGGIFSGMCERSGITKEEIASYHGGAVWNP